MTIQPLVSIPIDPLIASLPKANLHLHGEAEARLERLVARRRGHPLYDRRIGQEYAIAAALGFSTVELLAFTHNAIRASFTSTARRSVLIEELHLGGWC